MRQKKKYPCFDYAIFLLGRRPHSVKELSDKLKKKDYDVENIEETLLRLKGLGYLNDESFAKGRVRYRTDFSGWGRLKIAQELKQKGIEEGAVQEAIEEFENSEDSNHDWQHQATELLKRKFGTWPESVPLEVDSYASWEEKQEQLKAIQKEKTRRLQFLIRRGFSMDEASKALEEILR